MNVEVTEEDLTKLPRIVERSLTANERRNRTLVTLFLLFNPCKDCGEDDIRTLDFHHLGDKRFEIQAFGALATDSDTLYTEIQKCVVLCSNCHRRRHYNDHSWKMETLNELNPV